MAIVHGQIESLRRLREELHHNGISRFNSIAEINEFNRTYASERQGIINQALEDFNLDFNRLDHKKIKLQVKYEAKKNEVETKLDNQIEQRQKQLKLDKETYFDSVVKDFIHWISTLLSTFYLFLLRKTYKIIVWFKTFNSKRESSQTIKKLNALLESKEEYLKEKQSSRLNKLDHTKQTIDDLYPLIAGAIGESKVSTELEKLPDDYVLFNDFSLKFNPPIFNRKENDRIFSIQIDHLLVSPAGVFLIETKNWSQDSINNLSLRSPVEQVSRSGYALYTILNSKQRRFTLNDHGWGIKQLPVRNIIAMVNQKPKEKFSHVQVKTIKELNKYIKFFEPVLSEDEVEVIVNYLRSI